MYALMLAFLLAGCVSVRIGTKCERHEVIVDTGAITIVTCRDEPR